MFLPRRQSLPDHRVRRDMHFRRGGRGAVNITIPDPRVKRFCVVIHWESSRGLLYMEVAVDEESHLAPGCLPRPEGRGRSHLTRRSVLRRRLRLSAAQRCHSTPQVKFGRGLKGIFLVAERENVWTRTGGRFCPAPEFKKKVKLPSSSLSSEKEELLLCNVPC